MRSPLALLLFGLLTLGCGDDSSPVAANEAPPAALETPAAESAASTAAPPSSLSSGYDTSTLEADHIWLCELTTSLLNDLTRPLVARQAEALRRISNDPRGERVSAYLEARVPDGATAAGRHERVVATLREDGVEWSCPALPEFRRRLESQDENGDPSLTPAPDVEFARVCSIVDDFSRGESDDPDALMARVYNQVMKEVYHPRIREAWGQTRTVSPSERFPTLVAAASELGVESFDCPLLADILASAGAPLESPGGGILGLPLGNNQIPPEVLQQLMEQQLQQQGQ